MLEKISLKNFKAFSSLENLDIKPITILSGTNSCGKSSLLQSILLLKQTLESQSLNQTLLLNGRFVRLGTFENIIFHKKAENKVELKFSFSIRKEDFPSIQKKRILPLDIFLRELFPSEELPRSTRDRGAEYFISYKVVLKTIVSKSRKYQLKPVLVDEIELITKVIGKDKEVLSQSFVTVNYKDGDSYDLSWENVRTRYYRVTDSNSEELENKGSKVVKIEFSNLFPTAITSSEAEEPKHRSSYRDAYIVLRRANDFLQGLLSSYSYIGPLREEPSRRYIYENEIIEIGNKGENAAYIYLSEGEKSISEHYFYNPKTDSFERSEKKLKLSEAVQKWLDLMNIKKFSPEPQQEIIYLNLNASPLDSTRVSIADVGFGVSQVFPIVLEGLRMPRGSTLLLEQPEIHLHPNLQMDMADYFISLALSGKRVVVETHSDHIINRLVRRIVEDETSKLSQLIKIYFVGLTENGSSCEEICIDETLGIVNWPDSFFDQVAKEQQKIMLAGLKKRKASKPK
jgi:predicted ATPase